MDVQKLLENKKVNYNISGRDFVVKCFNPDHEDNNPSLRIDKITGKMHCFSCGFRGDIFDYYGEKINRAILKGAILKEKILALLKKNPLLPKGAIPFEIDYRGISSKTYKKFNAFTHSTEFNFIDRIVFPITNINDDIVGFLGRYLHSDANPKYKVVPSKTKLPLYPSKIKAIENSIILVEGIFDMLNLHDKGLCNVITGFGISRGQLPKWKNTKKRMEKLKQLKEEFSVYKLQGITKVFIMYDGDEPGRDAAKNLKEVLNEEYIVEIIDIDDGKDPGQFSVEQVKRLRGLIYENSNN